MSPMPRYGCSGSRGEVALLSKGGAVRRGLGPVADLLAGAQRLGREQRERRVVLVGVDDAQLGRNRIAARVVREVDQRHEYLQPVDGRVTSMLRWMSSEIRRRGGGGRTSAYAAAAPPPLGTNLLDGHEKIIRAPARRRGPSPPRRRPPAPRRAPRRAPAEGLRMGRTREPLSARGEAWRTGRTPGHSRPA